MTARRVLPAWLEPDVAIDPQSRTSTTLLNQVAAGGHEQAERVFYERYSRMVRAICLASGLREQDCDDVVQESVLAAVQGLHEHRYDRERGRFKSWFKGVIRHKIEHAVRKRVPGVEAPRSVDPDLMQVPDPAPGPAEQVEAAFEAEWQKAARDEALDLIRREVEPSTWQAYDLLVNKGWKPREVATLLGLSRNAVYIAKSRVENRLREMLRDPDE